MGRIYGAQWRAWRGADRTVDQLQEAIEYDGEEIAICEAGEVTFCLGEREYVLATGDSLHFKASIPHFWRNDGDSPGVACISLTADEPKSIAIGEVCAENIWEKSIARLRRPWESTPVDRPHPERG